jgi:hypothetical protein
MPAQQPPPAVPIMQPHLPAPLAHVAHPEVAHEHVPPIHVAEPVPAEPAGEVHSPEGEASSEGSVENVPGE